MTDNEKQPDARDPEVVPKAKPRQFSAAYKLGILREYEALDVGEKGALLRKEGLYSTHISNWRRQRERGGLDGLRANKRGRKADPQAREIAQLKRENEELEARLEQAGRIIEVQKKVSELFGLGEKKTQQDERS